MSAERSIEDRLATLEGVVGSALVADNAPNHSRWTCGACSATLGWVNPVDGTIRARVGLDAVYVTLGNGGKMTRICPKCCEPTVLNGEDVEALQTKFR